MLGIRGGQAQSWQESCLACEQSRALQRPPAALPLRPAEHTRVSRSRGHSGHTAVSRGQARTG